MFQSYQSKQINPDDAAECIIKKVPEIVSIVSIQTDQSRPEVIQQINFYTITCFNRINPNRSIPTSIGQDKIKENHTKFQSYQSKQINPDLWRCCCSPSWFKHVSIVSIQTDQSRLYWCCRFHAWTERVSIVSIQTDQSRQDKCLDAAEICMRFQSYQSKQINPDQINQFDKNILDSGFNRINPNRSIPTKSVYVRAYSNQDVSIVSIQTDQSRQGWL